jgi:tetratricopeptide (TPR) repeat protein
MRAKIYLISIIVLLSLLLFTATKQFMADLYWRMAHQDGSGPQKTIGYLEKCVDVDNKKALFHFSLGRAFLHKGLVEATQLRTRNGWIRKSIDEFHKAINLNPVHSDYHFHLGITYGSLPYPPPFYWKVIQDSFRRTAMLNPTNIRHLHSMGSYYLNEYNRLINVSRSTSDVRLAHYKKHVAMSKDNYQFYFRKLLDVNEEYLGQILARSFAVNQQYIDLKRVIRDTPSDHAFLARFLNRKGMWEEAKKEYREAINLEPLNPIHYSNFAYALFRRGGFEQAVQWWQKQKVLDPRNEKPYLSSAHAFVKLKRFDDALRELRELMVLYPENINYRVKLIKTLMTAHRLDEAIDEYHKIIEEDLNVSNPMYETIYNYKRQGNHRKAIKILNEALSSAVNR